MSIEVVDPLSGKPARYLLTAKDNRGIPGSFDYYTSDDGHVFLAEVPADLGRHYEGGYQKIPGSEAELAEMAKVDAYRLEAVKTLVPAGDFLEIGPWIGLVAYSAKQAGYRVDTLEMSQQCVDLMNGVGIAATQTEDPARTLADSGKHYDVIGLWHSIEHIPQPWNVIAGAARALRPGGLLVIAAPNPESAQLRAFGKHWYHLDAPRHLHLVSADHYEAIGRREGLLTVEKTSDDALGRILDRDGWVFETHRWVGSMPIVRGVFNRLFSKSLAKRHRPTPGQVDGAGYTLMMRRP